MGCTYLRKPKVPVDVAISLRGIAACRAMRGTWKKISKFDYKGRNLIPGIDYRYQVP